VIGRKPPESDRSSEERAAAAAARAARRGEDSPAAPEPSPARLPEPAPESLPEPRPAPPPEPPPEPEPELPPAPPRADRPAPPAPRPPVRRALPPRATSPAARPSGRAGRRVLALVALLVVGGALWTIYKTFQPGYGEGKGGVVVTIPSGADAGRIGTLLAERGVVDSGRFFSLNATLTMRRGKLKSGEYTLPRGMSNGDALDALTQGPKAKVVRTFSVTLPEGRSIRELEPAIKKSRVDGAYAKATSAPRAVRRARALGLPRSAKTPEGFLFPATYELLAGASAADLVARQLKAFDENFRRIDLAAARRRNLTRYDVVIIASMIEREAQIARERPLISAVIRNRLREGIPLGIDATIRYFENNWTQPLRVSELERDSPYNTRLRRGLPPTPIGNPGLSSLKAAANPAASDVLFYVVKPGTCGEHAFSETSAQFERDVAKYNSEREKAGGKSPTTC